MTNQSKHSDRDFDQVVREVYAAARDYQQEHRSYVKTSYLTDDLGEHGQRIGRAFVELKERGIAEPFHMGADDRIQWRVDPDMYVTERPRNPDTRPRSLSDPDDYLIDSDALPYWVPMGRRQIRINDYDQGACQWRRYPCPAEDCEAEFEHPRATFQHATTAHGKHYLKVLFGDAFDRVLIELHNVHELTPPEIRDVLPMNRETIRQLLVGLDAFTPYMNLPPESRPDSKGAQVRGDDWPVGINGQPLKHKIDVEAAILD